MKTFGQAEHDPHQHEACTAPTPTPKSTSKTHKLNPLFNVN